MKAQNKIICASGIFTVATLTFLCPQPACGQPPMPPPPPPVTVPPPPPVSVETPTPPPPSVTVQVGVPDYYVWDGYEYVGVVGNQYYYLAPGDVWQPISHERWERFEHWEHHHRDWQEHAIQNERYRRDAYGHESPWHEEREEHHEHHEHD